MAPFKIKLYNKISKAGTSRLEKRGYIVGEDVEEPDAIIVRSANLHDVEIPASVKCIARAGAGVNNIPIDKCSERGIVVFNTPGANANAVKELILCSLLLSSRKVSEGIEWVEAQEGGDDFAAVVEKNKSMFAGPEISGKTLGVIGLGAVGAMVANAAISLGMEVYGYDPYISVDSAWGLNRNVHRAENTKTIFEKSDYITLHVPLNKETEGMINADTIAHMKKGIRILNFARGELVNHEDIKEAVKNGLVEKYITDFPSADLLRVPGIIMTPHLGASTPESENNCAMMAADEVMEFLENGNIKYSVNLPRVSLEREGAHRLCVVNRNIPNMIGHMSAFLGKKHVNIDNMVNRSKNDFAYTIVDTSSELEPEVVEYIRNVKDVLSVRVI